MNFSSPPESRAAVALLFVSTAGLFLAVLASSWTLAGRNASPGRRAIAHWLPIATVAVLFAMRGQVDMAMGIIFGTSIAIIAITFGLIALGVPEEGIQLEYRPLWLFVPAATLLTFLVGLRGSVGWFDAGILLVEGGVLLYLWSNAAEDSHSPRNPPRTSQLFLIIGIIVVALFSAVAGIGALLGAEHTSAAHARYPVGVIAATLLSAAMTLPLILTSVPRLMRGEITPSLHTALGVVLLNLCALIPIAVLAWALSRSASAFSHGTMFEININAWKIFFESALPFPMLAWRIDALALVIVSVVLIPLVLNHVQFDRRLGGLLLLGYGFYILAVIVVGTHYRSAPPQSAPTSLPSEF